MTTPLDAIIATVDGVRTRASTRETLLILAVPDEYSAQIAPFLSKIGQQVGVAFSELERASRGPYSNEAQQLRQSGFFRRPEVWQAVGSDNEFLDWLRNRRCCVKGHTHGGVVVAAHVRRVSEGAGTGIKPLYCAVPMCAHHHDLQHTQGESAVGGRAFLDRMRVYYVEQWAWETLRAKLNYSHWYQVPPEELFEWARERDLEGYLPGVYRAD